VALPAHQTRKKPCTHSACSTSTRAMPSRRQHRQLMPAMTATDATHLQPHLHLLVCRPQVL
jgi:hypothetical protein